METYRWSGKQLKFRAMKKLLVALAVAVSEIVLGQRVEMSPTFIGYFEAFNEEFDIKNTWRFYDNRATNSFNMPAMSFIEPEDSLDYLEIIDFDKKYFYRQFRREDGTLFQQHVPMLKIYQVGDIKSCLVELLDKDGIPVPVIISIRMNELKNLNKYSGKQCIMFITQHEGGGVEGKLYNVPCFNTINGETGYGNLSVRF
jgi:hypothetical protein